MLSSSVVFTFESESVDVLFDASAMWDALVPGSLVRKATHLDEQALALLFSVEELALVDVAARGNFLSPARRLALIPHAIVHLPISHSHFAFPMSLSFVELTLVHIAILLGELALTMGSSIENSPNIDVT